MSLTGVIVQARMGSSRLPGKVAKEICGKPLLAHIIERLQQADMPDKIIVATSGRKIDDRVIEIARKEGVDYFRGPESDVLTRYIEAAREYGLDIVVRVTGDCPLISPWLLDKVLAKFIEVKPDYCRLTGGPRGLGTEATTLDTLLRAEEYITEEEGDGENPYREHVTLYIYRNPDKFELDKYEVPPELKRDYRLCVDEIDDFKLIERIYEELYEEGSIIKIEDAVKLLDDTPELAEINSHVQQKKV